MARVVVYQNGEVTVVTRAVPQAAAEAMQVVVWLTLRPLHRSLAISEADRAWKTVGAPVVPGYEGVDAVHSVGTWVTKVKMGQRVVPFLWQGHKEGNGSWQEYVVVPDDMAWLVPDLLLDVAAAQFVVIQLAKHFGFKTINVVRRAAQKEELKALGADEVISSIDEDVLAQVKEITSGKLAFGALDAVEGPFT